MKLFKKTLGQNEKLLKNLLEYEKKKTEQQESKILVKRQAKRAENKEKNINVYDSNRSKGLWSVVRKRLKF